MFWHFLEIIWLRHYSITGILNFSEVLVSVGDGEPLSLQWDLPSPPPSTNAPCLFLPLPLPSPSDMVRGRTRGRVMKGPSPTISLFMSYNKADNVFKTICCINETLVTWRSRLFMWKLKYMYLARRPFYQISLLYHHRYSRNKLLM